MASRLSGGGQFWTALAVNANDVSAVRNVGASPNVAIFIKNSGGTPTVITVQVGGVAIPTAGANAAPTDWFDYIGGEAISVGAGAQVCFDLSPFAPAWVRLKSSAGTTLTAFAVSHE